MKRPLLLPATAALLLSAGCVSRPKSTAAPEPFVFRSLDLQQQEPDGKPAWQLRSPEARYDVRRRLAQAREPRGIVYRRGKPHITVQARSGTVISDGQAIQLEGDVRITLLGKDPVLITGDQVRWLPGQSLMVIDRRPAALDRRSRITAQVARYHLDRDLVELRGEPLLEQWQSDKAPAGQRLTPPVQVRTAQVDWRPDQGDLRAPQPVRGLRRNGDSKLVLTARSLQGNLRQGFVDLMAPVQVRDLKGKGWLEAQQTRWAINDQQLSSNLPFQGRFNKLQGSGSGFQVNLADNLLTVTGACELQQPGEQLTAQRCLWRWPTGQFQALGNVVLRRSSYKQITRSSRLDGRIGKEGTAVFSSPGARVNSQFTLPPRQPGGKPQARRAAPVVF